MIAPVFLPVFLQVHDNPYKLLHKMNSIETPGLAFKEASLFRYHKKFDIAYRSVHQR